VLVLPVQPVHRVQQALQARRVLQEPAPQDLQAQLGPLVRMEYLDQQELQEPGQPDRRELKARRATLGQQARLVQSETRDRLGRRELTEARVLLEAKE